MVGSEPGAISKIEGADVMPKVVNTEAPYRYKPTDEDKKELPAFMAGVMAKR